MNSRWIPLVLVFLVGLHLPRAFTLLYLLYAVLFWQTRKAPAVAPRRLWPLLALAVFSVGYAWASLHYGLWSLHGRDLLDLISMLALPIGGVWLGARLAQCWTPRQLSWIWLAYGLGALAYVWVVLVLGRDALPSSPLEIWRQHRDLSIAVPWGQQEVMNVRSVEQNASFAVAWMFPGLWLLLGKGQSRLAQLMVAAGLLGLLAVLAFHGRIGLLVGLLSLLPLAWAVSSERQVVRQFFKLSIWAMSGLGGFLLLSLVSLLWGRGDITSRLLARVYDERLDRFLAFQAHIPETLWGGQRLSFEYFEQQRRVWVGFDASAGDLLHNVPFDLVVRAGLIPAIALLLAVVPLLCRSLRQLGQLLRDPASRGHALISACFLIVLTVQWLFQPLIYADGLLFYLGFFGLGALAFAPALMPPLDRE
ncbi:hypothetical protein [Synechococcus sp. W4D4]|uniref:hypothetical protein n=1 Tax=Synechococcus sp. W4D4 TaxID=3392294 RepID=UPI0039E77817